MTVSAALAASVTQHQVIILLACRIASASRTTFSTLCISMRIKAVYVQMLQRESAESPCEGKKPQIGRDDKNLLH